MEAKMWSTRDLAERAGVDPSRIRQLLIEGRINAGKVGGVWVIPDREAKRWLAERGVKVDAE